MNDTTPILVLEDAALRWETRTRPVEALGATSLRLEAGERVVVRGPSGAGKTSLLLVAGGMLQPTSGRAMHVGRVGFVFQTLELLPYLDVRENIAVGAVDGDEDCMQRLELLTGLLGLTDRLDHRPNELSTGECQRVATARALLSRPSLILADEPTGNLDEENARLVLEALAAETEAGAALLMATHAPVDGLEATRELRIENGMISATEGSTS